MGEIPHLRPRPSSTSDDASVARLGEHDAVPMAHDGSPEMTMDDVRATAGVAFVFGYPLVLMDVSRTVLLGGDIPGVGRGRPNAFTHVRAFPDASFTSVVSPNADTLYSTAMLDLATEPMLLHAPANDRYYLLPMLSGWTDVFASPGTRTTGSAEGTFAIAGPGWTGEVPAGVQQIRSPTSMVWLLGRTQTNGKADYERVHRFQDGLSLTPLSAWGSDYSPSPAAPADPRVDVATPPPDQVEAMDATTFFERLARLMVENPPTEEDAPAIERFAAIGLRPGAFEPDPDRVPALGEGIRAAMAQLKAQRQQRSGLTNGWSMSRNLGSYGTDYGMRAFVALVGLGANLSNDAVYPNTTVDGDGEPLTGAARYRLHFDEGDTPPAKAFWSLTMYNEHQYFVDNPLGRYAIGDRDPLTVNRDGSLDLWLSHDSPGAEREANWLPAPAGAFNLILRIYWPEQRVLEGGWVPPPVEKA